MKISIVIASGAGGEFLFSCLKSLQNQIEPEDEVIVVDRCGEQTLERLRKEFPSVNVIETNPTDRASVPELRKLGVLQAHHELVAILEEHCLATPEWVKAVKTGFHPEEDAAIGGPILDNNYERSVDWAVYFAEYHNYLPPWPAAERYLLNGANIAYRLSLLRENSAVLGTGYWEVVLHPILANKGKFRSIPDMGACHSGPFHFQYYLRQRYLLSRVWGGSQRSKVSPGRRLLYLLSAPIFPFLLLARIARRSAHDNRLRNKFVSVIPLLLPVTLAYVWGEWQGYLLGIGNALEEVE